MAAHISGPFVARAPGSCRSSPSRRSSRRRARPSRRAPPTRARRATSRCRATTTWSTTRLMQQIITAYSQAQQKGQKQGGGLVLSSLGVDFSKWLKNARNAGTAQVGDAQTTELTGDANVPQVVDDLDKIAAKANSLNLPGASGQLPDEAHAAAEAAGDPGHQGLHRDGLHGRAGQDPPPPRGQRRHRRRRGRAPKIALDLTFTKVGQDQAITAPKNAKPFSQLQSAIQAAGLGSLGSLDGAAAPVPAAARRPAPTTSTSTRSASRRPTATWPRAASAPRCCRASKGEHPLRPTPSSDLPAHDRSI